jgi:hypothetical protein
LIYAMSLFDDTITQLSFSVFENKGIYGLLLGSGLSRAADIPTGWEITLDLIRRVARAKGISEQSDWAKWYRDETGEDPNYSTLLAELATTPAERRAILHSYIEPSEDDREQGRKVPTAGHRAIARLVRGGYIRVIVTTNFDRLIENALREVGVEPTVVASPDALRGAEPIVHSSCYVLKLHGDYKDARILNVDEELKQYPKTYNELLDRIFDEHGLIVCGWSGEWDSALRSALQRAANRRYSMWWMSRGPVKAVGQDIIDARKARIVTAPDADTFFSSLHQKIETLAQTRQRSPESTELLVSSAKRYLARPEYRIQLDELVAQEGSRVLKLLTDDEFPVHGPTDAASLQARVHRYEAISEGLLKIAGVLGRWGDGKELPLVLDLIRSLYADAERIGSGLTLFLRMHSYPALLVVIAYGLGLVRSERWASLHEFFKGQIARESREPKASLSCFSSKHGRATTIMPGTSLREPNEGKPLSMITSSVDTRNGARALWD